MCSNRRDGAVSPAGFDKIQTWSIRLPVMQPHKHAVNHLSHTFITASLILQKQYQSHSWHMWQTTAITSQAFNLFSYSHTQVCALVTTSYLNAVLRESIYYLPVSFAMVFILIISMYAANSELHRLSCLENNRLTHDCYMSSSLSERFQFLFQTSDHYVVKYRTISATPSFKIIQSLQCDVFSFSCISHHFISLSWNGTWKKILCGSKNTLLFCSKPLSLFLSLTDYFTVCIWKEEIELK